MSLESPDNTLNVRNAVIKVSRVEMNTLSANTVSSNLTVAGDATMSSNLTVTGDLNVSGALGILDAIYPVGTVIDRATAITDTHPNGKYKAFLAAPNQEWELVSDGQDVVPLEFLSQLGNSSSFCGRGDMTPATAEQQLSSSHLPITGSVVENFTPVLGTKKIKYTFRFAYADKDENPMADFNIEVKEGNGIFTEVDESHMGFYDGESTINPRFHAEISWIFVLDDVDDSTVGTFAAERPTLGFRVTGRERGNNNEARVHVNPTHLPTNGSDTFTAKFRVPLVDIVSLGPVTTSKYKRTV